MNEDVLSAVADEEESVLPAGGDGAAGQEVESAEAAVAPPPLESASADDVTQRLEEATRRLEEIRSENERLSQMVAPMLEAQRRERERLLADDTWFNERVQEVGLVRAMRELNSFQLAEYDERQQQQSAAAQNRNAWDTANGQAKAYAKESGLSDQEWELLRMQFGGFPSDNPERSLALAKLAISQTKAQKDGPAINKRILTKADQDARRKLSAATPESSGAASLAPGKGGEIPQDFLSSLERVTRTYDQRSDLLG